MSDDVEVPCVSGNGHRVTVGTDRGERQLRAALREAALVAVERENGAGYIARLDLAGGRAVVQALARILGPEVLEPAPEPGEQYFRAKAKALGVPGSGRADWSKMIDQAKAEHAMVEAALIAQGWTP